MNILFCGSYEYISGSAYSFCFVQCLFYPHTHPYFKERFQFFKNTHCRDLRSSGKLILKIANKFHSIISIKLVKTTENLAFNYWLPETSTASPHVVYNSANY